MLYRDTDGRIKSKGISKDRVGKQYLWVISRVEE